MDYITFCVIHHSDNNNYTQLLLNCVDSIRLIYPNNKIIITHTSTSHIPESIKKDLNIYIQITPKDGCSIYGGIYNFIQLKLTNYMILIHDSMVLTGKIPEDIVTHKFIPIWHFQGCQFFNLYSTKVTEMINNSNLNSTEIQAAHQYYELPNDQFFGCFGPVFGCTLDVAIDIWNISCENINNLSKFIGRLSLESSERYLAILSNIKGWIKSPSLCGNYTTINYTPTLTLPQILNLHKHQIFVKMIVLRQF